MTFSIVYYLIYGIVASAIGLWIGYLILRPRLNILAAELEIKHESYKALKGQYETNLREYESLHHSKFRQEEKLALLRTQLGQTQAEKERVDQKNLTLEKMLSKREESSKKKNSSSRKGNYRSRQNRTSAQSEKQHREVVVDDITLKDESSQ